MTEITLTPGVLKVGSAFPDPPFEVQSGGTDTGFDAELMQEVCRLLSLEWQLVKYEGDNFNGIFAGLAKGTYDAVISGTSITPERQQAVLFSDPYAQFNQGLAVNFALHPEIKSTADLAGQMVGIQFGNTSDRVAKKLLAQGAIGGIQYYPYHGIDNALDELESGKIAAFIKLFPVISYLVEDRPDLRVVEQIATAEKLAVAFAPANTTLCAAVNKALSDLRDNGIFDQLSNKWLSGQRQNAVSTKL